MSFETLDDIKAVARNLGLEFLASDGLVIWNRNGKNQRAFRALQDMLVAANKSFALYFTAGDSGPRIHVLTSTHGTSTHGKLSDLKPPVMTYHDKIDAVVLLARQLNLPMQSFIPLRLYKSWTNPAQVKPFADVLFKVKELGLPYTIDNETDFDLSYIVIPFQEAEGSP